MYCDFNEIRQRRRIEVTIKKTAEIKKVFDVYESNLNSLLSLTQEQMRDYCVMAINKNLIQTCKVEKSAISNNNLETLIHIHFSNSMNNQGQTFMQTLNSFLEHFEGNAKNKYRMKLKAKKWFESKNSTEKDVSEEVQDILKLLGVK
jgi:endonuclease III